MPISSSSQPYLANPVKYPSHQLTVLGEVWCATRASNRFVSIRMPALKALDYLLPDRQCKLCILFLYLVYPVPHSCFSHFISSLFKQSEGQCFSPVLISRITAPYDRVVATRDMPNDHQYRVPREWTHLKLKRTGAWSPCVYLWKQGLLSIQLYVPLGTGTSRPEYRDLAWHWKWCNRFHSSQPCTIRLGDTISMFYNVVNSEISQFQQVLFSLLCILHAFRWTILVRAISKSAKQ